ncbi:hypothetical protein IW152_004895 [Coemansia sp. BCRC 34962]|nr:hypothetical protein IW152_004895 [Coemansia sp. BCRC 34962]
MNRRVNDPVDRSQRLSQQRLQQPLSLANGGSPALTIDNDSFSSIRPHVMGHPGARVHPPLLYGRTSPSPPPPPPPPPPLQQLSSRGDRHEKTLRRRNESSPLGITRHNALHKQLLLVDTPNPHLSQSLVGRLSVVRPSNDDIIVVEAKRSPGSSDESPSVEAIYQVIGSRSMARVPQPQPQPAPPKTTLAADGRPIAIPKSRLGKLRPAQRNLPTSRQVVEAGPVYTRDGSFRARRPESIILMKSEEESATAPPEPPAIEISDSYCNDIGYDLASAEIDSLYCRSFDIDLLPDAPERKLSFYNIGVKDVPMKPKVSSDDAPSASQKEPVNVIGDAPTRSPEGRPYHRTLGIDSTGSPFALPNIRQDSATDFYARVLAMRSGPNPPLASPTSPAKTMPEPVVRRDSTASQQHQQHQHRYHSQRRHSQRQRHCPPTPKPRIAEPPLPLVEVTPVAEEQQVPTAATAAAAAAAAERCIELPSVDCLRIPLPQRVPTLEGRFFFRRRPKSAPTYEIHTSDGEWSAQPRSPTEKSPAMRKSTTAATLPYTDNNNNSVTANQVLLPPAHISSSTVRGEQSAQMRQRHLGPTLGAQPAQLPMGDDGNEKPGCGVFACNSCWPTTAVQQQRAGNGDISQSSRIRQSSRLAGGTAGLLPSLASSWAHIYRSRPQNPALSQGQQIGWRERQRIRGQNRSQRARSVLTYPFQLGYNCLLWWLGPCVGLARECRSA